MIPEVSWITVLLAKEVSREAKSKYSFDSGSFRETWRRIQGNDGLTKSKLPVPWEESRLNGQEHRKPTFSVYSDLDGAN